MSAQANPFSAKMIAALVFVGLVATAALLLIFAFGGQSAGRSDGRAHALSLGATGFKALVTLSDAVGETMVADRAEELADAGLVVVAIEPQSKAEEIERLRELRRGRPTLLILPKWATTPDPSRRGWVRAIGPMLGARGAALIDGKLSVRVPDRAASGPARGLAVLAGISAPAIGSPQIVEGAALQPVLSIPGRGAIIAQLGNEPHYVAADPDLFNNHGLRDPATARAALAILARLRPQGTGIIAFDVTVNGFGSGSGPNLIRTALEPPFLPMILALAVAALLAGLHGAFRFGQARREARAIAFGKAALVENSAGLIKLAKREARLGGAYAEVVRQDAARLTGAPPALQGEALDAYLDRLGREDMPPFSALAARLAAARDRNELVAAARALFSWKKDIIR